MKSTFKFAAYIRLIVLLPLVFGFVAYIWLLVNRLAPIPPLAGLPLLLLLSFTIIRLVFGELRTKMIKIVIERDLISVRGFGGLLRKSEYSLSDFDEFRTTKIFSDGNINEYLYLIKRNRKIIKLSQAYHKNYAELKAAIQLQVEDLGYEQFNFMDEIKEIFM